MDLEKHLSPPQLEAATHVAGPVCILAGAGSGKTRVVTYRIAHLIDVKLVRPWQILAVTFTNKAAGEMRERVEQLVPGAGREVRVGTFHGTAARILRRHGEAVGIPSSFVIYDQDDAQRLMRRVVVEELNWTKDLVRPFMWRVDSWQSEGLWPDQVPETPWNDTDEKARQAYGRYVERLAEMGAVDFGGLLLKLRDLVNHPAGKVIKRQFRHLLVDEYQDTNAVQAEIVMELAKQAETVAVVGDDDQAIYGWRGASADNLKRFVEDMEGAHLVRLEDNYRSTANILEAANEVIAKNTVRLGKTLRATGDQGRRVRVIKARDDIDEARKVISTIQEHRGQGHSLEEVAILYRTNAVSRLFEDELRRASLNYRLVGGVRFYDRKEVKDVLATLRCALNVKSDVDTVRMLTAVPRGIGDKSLRKIQNAAASRGLSVLEAMARPEVLEVAGVAARTRSKAEELATKVMELGDRIRPRTDDAGEPVNAELDARAAVALAVEASGVADRLEAEGTVEAEGRLENLSALLNAAAQHVADAQEAGTFGDVMSFLENASLMGGDENVENEALTSDKVTLMTLHAAKGLEFDTVFLVGLEEHGFPHSRALAEDGDPTEIEEERRLAYVGITRAKRRLVVTWAQRRMVQGSPRPRRVSRFVTDLPRHVLEGDIPAQGNIDLFMSGGGRRSFGSGYRERFDDDDGVHIEYEPAPTTRRASRRASLLDESEGDAVQRSFDLIRQRLGGRGAGKGPAPSAGSSQRRAERFSPDEAEAEASGEPVVVLDADVTEGASPEDVSNPFGPGARVSHRVFGEGSVVGLRGAGRMQSALVRFDGDNRPRVIILRHLSPLEDELADEPRVVLDEAGLEP